MIKSIAGLCAIIQDQFSQEVSCGSLYLFCGRKCDRFKAILREPDGITLIYKRLTVSNGRYRWPYMMTYLDDGRCSFCNNLSEIEIKPVALGRKNYLFSDTPAGAEASAIIYSLVETAKANNINILQYLGYLLDELPKTNLTEEDFERYLPWNSDVKTDLENRSAKLLEE